MVRMTDITDLQHPHLPDTENEMSRRYLRMIEQWIPTGIAYFADWPDRPNCGHFFGGCHWYGIETISCAETFAYASTSPEYDEASTGVSRDTLREMAIKGVRYLCFTHDSGPEDCVRPSEGLGRTENCGTKWGERGKGFFRESQCGSTVAGLARICLLLREWIDRETYMMVARVHEDYAARFGDMAPKSGVYTDTQMEENAWTSHGLTSCFLFLSEHADAATWEATARRWMFSTCAAPQDAKDLGLVGRETARTLTGKIFTALPDYLAENHGMVHPSYTASGLSPLMSVGCLYQLWGRELPPELFWNKRRVYENLKALTDGGGYAQAVQGMDWHYLNIFATIAAHAIAAVYFDDADAAALERLGLEHAERRQRGNGGRMYDQALAQRAHDQQDPMIMREVSISGAAGLYLLHRLLGPGPSPAPTAEMESRLSGVCHFPHGGFVHHRHPHGQTSFAWRNSIMALPLTREGIYTIAPCSDTWLGTPIVQNRPDSHRLKTVRIAEYDDSFAAALVIDRCQESLRQHVLFASLPDGRILSFEKFTAREELVLEELNQGFLRITNEHFSHLAPNCRGERVLYRPDGETRYAGWHGESESDDIIDNLSQPPYLNIDNRLGIHFTGNGDTIYHNRHYFNPYRAIADDLTLSRLSGEKPLRAGEEAGRLTALLIPEQTAADTPDTPFEILTASEDGVGLIAQGYLAAANFGTSQQICTFTANRTEQLPIFPGTILETHGNRARYRIPISGESACLLRATQRLNIEGDVRIDAISDGALYVSSSEHAKVKIAGEDRTHTIGCGEIRRIDE
ncbi:MAG: hypothetical protein F4W91_04645 [Gemmatimonadetes bacterium]|nr:hypothetical protein [Gemmatimonadota bacterium]